MCSLFLSKVPVYEPLPGSPLQGPYVESCPLTGSFYTSLKFLIKIPLNKEIYPFSQRAKERRAPPCSPKVGPLWKQTSISKALLSISLGVTSKEALPPSSPHRAPSEWDAPSIEPSFIHHSMSVLYEPPSRFPRVRVGHNKQSHPTLIHFPT